MSTILGGLLASENPEVETLTIFYNYDANTPPMSGFIEPEALAGYRATSTFIEKRQRLDRYGVSYTHFTANVNGQVIDSLDPNRPVAQDYRVIQAMPLR